MKNLRKPEIDAQRSKCSQEIKGQPADATQQQENIPPLSNTNRQDKQTAQDTVELVFLPPLPHNAAFLRSLDSLVGEAEAKGKTLEDIAQCAQMPLSMLRDWLIGIRNPNRTSFKCLRRLAICLDAAPEFLVDKVRKDRGWNKCKPSKDGSKPPKP